MEKGEKKVIVHIYYGTSGNYGLYIHETLSALRKIKCDILAFVNYYYLFDDKECQKVFFRLSEFMKRNVIRKYIKFVELIYDLFVTKNRIKKLAKKYKEVVIVYSLNESYVPVFWFLKKLKKLNNIKLTILVHDAVPFALSYTKAIYVPQSQILKLADCFIAHNDYTKRILEEAFPEKRIVQYRFPLLDLRKLEGSGFLEKSGQEEVRFLFLGFLRKEKGIDVLLKAWKIVEEQCDYAYLVIAGKTPENIKYDFANCRKIKRIDKYLTDTEYCDLIRNANYGILPYTEGTNSGILSTISSYGIPSVVSSLSMFQESEFVISELIFEKGNADALAELLLKLLRAHKDVYSGYLEIIDKKIDCYKEKFDCEVNEAYSDIL